MEKYLIEEYNCFEDSQYLTEEKDIKNYFYDNGSEFLECGQGYFDDERTILTKVGDNFYIVYIEAEIGSSKQEYGDRLYHIERIKNVKYNKINKPQPKEKLNIEYKLNINKTQKEQLEEFMRENHIEF